MNQNMHLVVEVGTLLHEGLDPESLRRLADHLHMRPEISLTMVTRGPSNELAKRLESYPALPVSQIIAEAGTAVYHQQPDGSWMEDPDYRAQVESLWNERALERLVEWGAPMGTHRVLGAYSGRHVIFEVDEDRDPAKARQELTEHMANAGLTGQVVSMGRLLEVVPQGADRGTAVSFVHRQMPEGSLLMVCGSSELNLNLFNNATFPVLMADSPLDFETPGIPRSRISRTSHGGPAGVMEALLRVEFDLAQTGGDR